MPVIFSTATTRSAGTRCHLVIAARERPRPRAIGHRAALRPDEVHAVHCRRQLTRVLPKQATISLTWSKLFACDGAMRRRNRHP